MNNYFNRGIEISLEERSILVSAVEKGYRVHGVSLSIWENHGLRRLYFCFEKLGGKRESTFIDLNNDEDLTIDLLGVKHAIEALREYISANTPAPVVEEVAAEEISEPVLRATVIDSSIIDEAVAEMEAETARYHAHFAEQAATLGMTGEALEMAFVDWRDAIVAPIAKSYNPNRPWHGWAHIQNSLNMWDIFFNVVAEGDLSKLPQTLEYTGGEPQIVF